MQLLDDLFGKGLPGDFQHIVERLEMVDRFNYIVRADGGVPIGQKRVGFIDEARLLVGEPAAFNAIGVVCEQDLCLVIQPSLAVGVFFFQKLCQQVHTHAPPF